MPATALTTSVKTAAARACVCWGEGVPRVSIPNSFFYHTLQVAKLFSRLDKNGDGKISLEELAEGLKENTVLDFDRGAYAGVESGAGGGAAANPTLTKAQGLALRPSLSSTPP